MMSRIRPACIDGVRRAFKLWPPFENQSRPRTPARARHPADGGCDDVNGEALAGVGRVSVFGDAARAGPAAATAAAAATTAAAATAAGLGVRAPGRPARSF